VKTSRILSYLLILTAVVSSPIRADELEDLEKAELAKQEAFRSGFAELVEDMNYGSFSRFIESIDQKDFIDRVYGLRLIDQKIKKQFNEKLEFTYQDLIMSGFAIPEEGLKATLLGIESRGDHGRAVVRFDYPDFEFSYHEYDLRLDEDERVIVVDWIDFGSGMRFSESIGRPLVMVAPSKPAMRKLLDFQNVSERDLFQFGELLKAARDRQLDRYMEIREGLSPQLQRQRIVVESSVQVARQVRKRRQMIAGLQVMAEHFPDEPLYTLMLLDYYFPSRKYEEAMQSLQLLADRLDVGDAAMEARFSAAALVMGNPQAALAYADMAVGREPGLELGWWSALNARAALADFSGSVEALQKLEGDFGYELGPDALKRNPSYAQLLESAEYRSWRESIK